MLDVPSFSDPFLADSGRTDSAPKKPDKRKVSPPVFELSAENRRKALVTANTEALHVNPADYSRFHSNQPLIVLNVIRTLRHMGYTVDAINLFDEESLPPTQDYDVLFGEFDNFHRLAPYVRPGGVKVFHGTRPYWRTEVEAIQRRLDAIERTYGVRLPVPPWERGAANMYADEADSIMAVVPDSFSILGKPLEQINNPFIPYTPPPVWEMKQWETSRNHFLWAGTGSFVRKGLDLVLEVFAETPEKHLWMCAPFHWKDHRQFLQLFRDTLFYRPNIHPVGFIGITSLEWRLLTDHCGFFIYPSCAEAMCTAVLNAMVRGVVPLVSAESTVNIGTGGLILRGCTREAVQSAIAWTDSLSFDDLEDMAHEAHNIVVSQNSMRRCENDIRAALAKLLPDECRST